MQHTLRGNAGSRRIWLDGMVLDPGRSQAVCNHSPDGFAWGYGGSGPSQLALAVVLQLTGKSEGYQDFKWDVVAKLPMNESFNIDFDYPSVISKEQQEERK